MKGKALKILAISLLLMFVVSGVVGVTAAKYPASMVASASDYANFVQPGDLNADKTIGTDDVKAMKGLILADSANKFSDANGDDLTNICDLVFQGEQGAYSEFYDGSKINLKGKSVYNGDSLTAGGQYEVSGADGIKIILNDGNTETEVSGTTFKAPLDIENGGVAIKADNATVTSLKIYRINMDNNANV